MVRVTVKGLRSTRQTFNRQQTAAISGLVGRLCQKVIFQYPRAAHDVAEGIVAFVACVLVDLLVTRLPEIFTGPWRSPNFIIFYGEGVQHIAIFLPGEPLDDVIAG